MCTCNLLRAGLRTKPGAAIAAKLRRGGNGAAATVAVSITAGEVQEVLQSVRAALRMRRGVGHDEVGATQRYRRLPERRQRVRVEATHNREHRSWTARCD